MKAFDPKCLELAQHFLPEDADEDTQRRMASEIQGAVEDFLFIEGLQ
jgi:hypothetical protein